MRFYFVSLLLLLYTTVFSQAESNDQLKKIIQDVLQDSALGSDLAKVNGLPQKLHFTIRSEEKKEVVLDGQLIQKEYYSDDKELLPATVSHYKYQVKKARKVASFTLLLPDGTKVSIRAVLFSQNKPWYPVFYHLRGRNMETGGKVRIIRVET